MKQIVPNAIIFSVLATTWVVLALMVLKAR